MNWNKIKFSTIIGYLYKNNMMINKNWKIKQDIKKDKIKIDV